MAKKRPNPSPNPAKDEAKKARIAPTSGEYAGWSGRLAAAATNASAAVSSAIGYPSTATATAPSAKDAAKKESAVPPALSKKVANGSGNAFLKSARGKLGGTAAKKDAPLVSPPPKKNATANSKGKPATKEPVVPFPHLPLESMKKSWAVPLVVFLLFLLNMGSAGYIASLQAHHNLVDTERLLEVNRLQEELRTSQDEVGILMERLQLLENAKEARDGTMTAILQTSQDEVGRLMERLKLLEQKNEVLKDEKEARERMLENAKEARDKTLDAIAAERDERARKIEEMKKESEATWKVFNEKVKEFDKK
ncbi:hypothetical protein ACHAXT_001264 [Thalassiosira profunda]